MIFRWHMEDIKAPEVGEEEFLLDHGHVGCLHQGLCRLGNLGLTHPLV